MKARMKMLISQYRIPAGIARVSTMTRSKYRLRSSLFPGFAPYFNFIGPDDEYADNEVIPELLDAIFTVARGTGPVVIECLRKFGFRIIEVTFLILKQFFLSMHF